MDFNKLRPFIADSDEDGPDSVLLFKGFSGQAEINKFIDALIESGVLKPSASLQQ